MEARERSGEAAAVGGTQAFRAVDYAEDATGFGAVEFRTTRDLLLRPRDVLDAYLAHGSTGGGRYARPMRLYLALCGVLMFYLFLVGGTESLISGMPADLLDRTVARSGKTREAFLNDADGWMSLTSVPLLSFFYALAVAPLLKRWTRCGWRPAFRATFALLCAWTVPMLPFGPLPYVDPYRVAASVLIWVILVFAFVRMGRGRWWTGRWEAAGKSLLLIVAINVAGVAGSVAAFAVALLGGIYGS